MAAGKFCQKYEKYAVHLGKTTVDVVFVVIRERVLCLNNSKMKSNTPQVILGNERNLKKAVTTAFFFASTP